MSRKQIHTTVNVRNQAPRRLVQKALPKLDRTYVFGKSDERRKAERAEAIRRAKRLAMKKKKKLESSQKYSENVLSAAQLESLKYVLDQLDNSSKEARKACEILTKKRLEIDVLSRRISEQQAKNQRIMSGLAKAYAAP